MRKRTGSGWVVGLAVFAVCAWSGFSDEPRAVRSATGPAGGLWSENASWHEADGGEVPRPQDEARIQGNHAMTLDSTQEITGLVVSIFNHAHGTGTLTITEGGSLINHGTGVIAARTAGDGTGNVGVMTIDGGSYTGAGSMAIAGDSSTRTNTDGTLQVLSGSFALSADSSDGRLAVGFGGAGSVGTLNLSGGTVDVWDLVVGNENSRGVVSIDGGTLTIRHPHAGGIGMDPANGNVHLTDGVLEWWGNDHVGHLGAGVDAGLITWGGTTDGMLFETWDDSWVDPETGSILYAYRDMTHEETPTYAWSTGSPPPPLEYVPYADEEGKWLNIYPGEDSESGPPAPVYIWAHGGDGSADHPTGGLLDALLPAGITLVSWASINNPSTADDFQEAVEDSWKVVDFVLEHAAVYNFDTNRVVMGGTSWGSGISWPVSNQNPVIKGIYSTGALPYVFWNGWDPRDEVHAGSPPMLLAYPDQPSEDGYGSTHDPYWGLLAQERYVELGIGDRAIVEHSLNERGLKRWDFIVDFIREATAEPVSIFNPYEGVNWETFGQHKGNLHTHTTLHKVLANGNVVFATGEIRAADGTVLQEPVEGYSHRSGERHPDYENADGAIRGSDGHITPMDIIDWYYHHGYSVLALTDHNRVTWPWTDYARDPVALNMIAIEGSEPSTHHHIGSYFNSHGTLPTIEESLDSIGSQNGVSVVFHPGRYTESVEWYVNLYEAYDHLVGMEVYNQGDRYPGDRALWDAVLMELMPHRPVWGFSNDDMHRASHLGRNWQTFLLPELTEEEVRIAMENGHFYFSYAPDGHLEGGEVAAPVIQAITVDEALRTISIEAAGHTNVTWVFNGTAIESGEAWIDVSGLRGTVRAVLIGPSGRTYTQPFYVADSIDGMADTDQDGIPDWWEEKYFGGPTNAVATDLASNEINTVYEAYLAGLDPTNPQSVFRVDCDWESDRVRLGWSARSGRVYTVYRATDLFGPFVPVDKISYPDTLFIEKADAPRSGFYKLSVELAP